MLNKRGDITTEEIVKTILAIGVLIVIGLLFVSLIKIVTTNLHTEQAKNTLEFLSDGFKGMENGQIKEFTIESPKDWVFMFNDTKFCLCSSSGFDKMECNNNQACVDLDKNITYDYDGTSCISWAKRVDVALDKGDSVWYKRWFPTVFNPTEFETVFLAEYCFVHVDPVPRTIYVRKTNDYYYVYINDEAYRDYSKNKECSLKKVDVLSQTAGDNIDLKITSSFSGCDFSLLKIASFDLLYEDESSTLTSSCRFSNIGFKNEKKISDDYVSGETLSLSCTYPKNQIVSGKYKIKYDFIWEYSSSKNGMSDVFNVTGLNLIKISNCGILGIDQIGSLKYNVLFNESCGDSNVNAQITIYDSTGQKVNVVSYSVTKSSGSFDLSDFGNSYIVCNGLDSGKKKTIKVDIADLTNKVIFTKSFEHVC